NDGQQPGHGDQGRRQNKRQTALGLLVGDLAQGVGVAPGRAPAQIMKMDWSPRSRTSNPRSRSPATPRRALDHGKCFTTGERRAGSSGDGVVVEESWLTVKASRKGRD